MHVKKNTTILFLLLSFFMVNTLEAQISHGGKPLPFVTLRSVTGDLFREMPAFDAEAEKRIDSLNQDGLRGSFRFAYKFMTDFTPGNSGQFYTLPDGTKVWRLGIRSKGAWSINVMFSEYELPEGAMLFLYSPDQNQILGSFNHLNNSELGVLPVAPVHGEELIIEYQEPPGADFPGRLRVGEVNHAYRNLRGAEPGNNLARFACMPSPVCLGDSTDKYKDITRSTVLLIIDGVTLCSGVLLNNTMNDGTPYLLTAAHCLNKEFTITNPDYAQIAGTIVSFFNYESPLCSPVLRGTEEQSMASAIYRAVNEKTDMALLELLETPPASYQPYYAGWSIEEAPPSPYANIHHPEGAVKRVNTTKGISLVSHPGSGTRGYSFNANSHWNVKVWETGSTAGGSSGSPLFDTNNRVIGGLTGGNSYCSKPIDDIFFALYKSWTAGRSDMENLKPWLNPAGSNQLYCDGLDPYEANKGIELSNVRESGNRESVGVTYLPAPGRGQQFGVNSLGTVEYAESYAPAKGGFLSGVYLVTPAAADYTDLNVTIDVYNGSGSGGPSDKIYSAAFSPAYTNKRIFDNNFQQTNKPLSRAQESFVKFDSLVTVGSQFFIGYRISALEKDSFAVYNLPQGKTEKNTAWVKYGNKWIENTNHPANPFKTSLFISPVLQYEAVPESNDTPRIPGVHIYSDRNADQIIVSLPGEITRIGYEIFSVDGRLVKNGILANPINRVPFERDGVFIIRLLHEGQVHTGKVSF